MNLSDLLNSLGVDLGIDSCAVIENDNHNDLDDVGYNLDNVSFIAILRKGLVIIWGEDIIQSIYWIQKKMGK